MANVALKGDGNREGTTTGRKSPFLRYLPWAGVAGAALGGIALLAGGEKAHEEDIAFALRTPRGWLIVGKKEIACSVSEGSFSLFISRPGTGLMQRIHKANGDPAHAPIGIELYSPDSSRFLALVLHPSDIGRQDSRQDSHYPGFCFAFADMLETSRAKADNRILADRFVRTFGEAIGKAPSMEEFRKQFAAKGEEGEFEEYVRVLGQSCYVNAALWVDVRHKGEGRFRSAITHELFHGQVSLVTKVSDYSANPEEEVLARLGEVAYSEDTQAGFFSFYSYYIPEAVWRVREEAIADGVLVEGKGEAARRREEISAYSQIVRVLRDSTGARSDADLLDVDRAGLKAAARKVLEAEFQERHGKRLDEVVDESMFMRVLSDPCINSLEPG